MDTRLKEIVDNFDKMQLSVDDAFPFHCTMCGKCCIHREDILLTPRDMYRMAKKLEITPKELLERYCETYVGCDSRIPVVRLKPRGSIGRCPLLKDRKCSVHDAKPTVCAMFPIGRCMMIDANDPSKEVTPADIRYFFSDPECGDDSEIHTVREWLEEFEIPVEDVFFVKWQHTIIELGNQIRHMEKSCTERTLELTWTVALVALYLEYDTKKEFLPQFEKNAEKLFSMISMAPTKERGESHV